MNDEHGTTSKEKMSFTAMRSSLPSLVISCDAKYHGGLLSFPLFSILSLLLTLGGALKAKRPSFFARASVLPSLTMCSFLHRAQNALAHVMQARECSDPRPRKLHSPEGGSPGAHETKKMEREIGRCWNGLLDDMVNGEPESRSDPPAWCVHRQPEQWHAHHAVAGPLSPRLFDPGGAAVVAGRMEGDARLLGARPAEPSASPCLLVDRVGAG